MSTGGRKLDDVRHVRVWCVFVCMCVSVCACACVLCICTDVAMVCDACLYAWSVFVRLTVGLTVRYCARTNCRCGRRYTPPVRCAACCRNDESAASTHASTGIDCHSGECTTHKRAQGGTCFCAENIVFMTGMYCAEESGEHPMTHTRGLMDGASLDTRLMSVQSLSHGRSEVVDSN